MRIACKLMLLAGMAVAVMASTAVTASAQETPVTVLDEHTGLECNPCTGHAVGETHIVALPSGVLVTRCMSEVEGNVYADGSGETEWTGTAHGSPGCNVTNCTTGDEGHWQVTEAGELGTGEGHATLRFCLRSGAGVDTHCELERHLEDDISGDHTIVVSIDGLCAGGARRFEAVLTSESDPHDEIEVIHSEAD